MKELPIDAAVQLNLCRMGFVSEADVNSDLVSRYSTEATEWLRAAGLFLDADPDASLTMDPVPDADNGAV